MEQNISGSEESFGYKSTICKISEILGIQSNHFKDIKRNTNGKQLNNTSDIFDVRNFYFLRKKRLLSSLENDDFNATLSDYLILLIFAWLSKQDLARCTMVCKRWYQIAQTEILWDKLDLNKKSLHDDTLYHILSRGVKVLRISQAKILMLTSQERKVNINGNDMYKLQYLDASVAMISPENLATLLSKCRDLEKLSLESCTLNTECCEAIAHCTNLSVLNLAMCKKIDFKCVLNLLKLRSLTELNVAWCSLDKACVTLICTSLPSSITRLNISGYTKELTDDSIANLVKSCPNLIELDISDCALLTSDSIYNILKFSKLQHLALSRCYGIDPSLYIILTRMPCLMYLDIFGLSQEIVLKGLRMNNFLFSSIARPTTGHNRGTIWGLRVIN